MENHENEREYRAAAIFLLMSLNKVTAEDCATVFGITAQTVFNDTARIRDPTPPPKGEWGGAHNRLKRFEEEAQFLAPYLPVAQDGQIITAKELHHEYNKFVGRDTAPSTFYRLLKRHDWRLVLPDTRHPKASPEAQEEFKKKHSRKRWRKLASKT
jgi:transposase